MEVRNTCMPKKKSRRAKRLLYHIGLSRRYVYIKRFLSQLFANIVLESAKIGFLETTIRNSVVIQYHLPLRQC